VILDRESGARRDLLAAPISRPLIVFANLAVALAVTALQVVVSSPPRSCAARSCTPSARGGLVRRRGRAAAVGMYGVAETLANRIPTLRSTPGRSPRCDRPFFFAARSSRSARFRGS